MTCRSSRLAQLGIAAIAATGVLVGVTPAIAQGPGITSVVPGAASADATLRVTGTGFGATVAANDVTFTTAQGGPAVAGAVTATSALDATGTLRRLTVVVPKGLPVGPAQLAVRNTTTGQVSTGVAIEVVGIASGVGLVNPGQTVEVPIALTGNATFDPASTRATMGAGITVSRTAVVSPRLAVATITVAATAAPGPRTVGVVTPTMTAVSGEGLRVEAPQPGNTPPTARIAGPETGTAGSPLDFDGAQSSDPDGDPLTFAWSFGDGTSAAGATVTRPYAQAGSFTVSLTVSDGRGGANTATRSVTIAPAPAPNQPPTARFTASSLSIEAGGTVSFDASTSTDPDGDPLSFEWSFGDGGTATGATAQRTYATATGSPFTVTLTVRDGRGGVDSASRSVAVTAPPAPNRNPTAVLSATTASPQLGQVVGFDASGSSDPDGDPLSYSWAFGDGASASGVSASHAFSGTGPFTVTLTVNDGRGGIASAQTVIAPTAPTGENRAPTAVITSFDSGVAGAPFVFSGAGSSDPDGDPLTYRWLLGDGTEATGADVTRAFAAAASYVVTLTVSDGRGGAGTATRSVTIVAPPAQNQVPTAVIVAPATAGTGQPVVLGSAGSSDPDGDPLSFVWAFGDGTAGSGAATAKTYAAPGEFTVTLRASDGRGGVATATHVITVSAPVQTNTAPTAVILSADRVLAGRPLLLNGGASSDLDGDPLTFAWTFEGGGTATGENASHTFPAAGTFTVSLTVTDGRGGAQTATKSIRVDDAGANRAPTAVISGATDGVTGVELVFDGRGSTDPDGDALEFAWAFGVTGASSAGPTTAFVYEQAGTFTVTLTVTDAAGNSDTATRSIAIAAAPDRAPPIVTLTGPAEALPGAQARFTATATDNVGVVAVRFEVDGLAGAEPTEEPTPPYTRTLTLPAVVAPGQQVRVTAFARDAAGNVGSASALVTITNLADTSEPTVSLSAPPRAGAGEQVTLLARVADDRGVARVVFLLDGVEVAGDDTEPFEAAATVPASAPPGTFVLALARAVDLSGNTAESAAQIAVATSADTAAPTVALDTPLEVVAGTALPITASAQDAIGIASVTFDVDGAALPTLLSPPYQATYPVPASALPGSRISIRAVARDFSTNSAEATRAVKVIAPPTSTRGVITGEVYDDTTGLPLPGALVSVAGVDALGSAYGESATSDARGRYVLRAAAGDARLVITRAGYTRVDRWVSIRGGLAVEAFDARLTPITGAEVIVSSVLGGTVDGGDAALAVEAGSLTADAALRLVGIGQQGLANRLPAGWSPVAAVEVLPRTAQFTSGAQVRVGNVYSLPPATPLVLARYDQASGAWVVVGGSAVDAAGHAIAGDVPGGGQFAFLLADTVPVSPPAAVPGSPLEGVTSPVLPSALDASLAPRPRVLFYAPGARSVVTGSIASAGPLSSGSPLQARVSERYEFQDEGVVTTLPFVADLTFFQAGAGANALGAAAPVTPSLSFEPITLREGIITVELFVPAAGEVTPVAGPDGATVQGPGGERLQVPFGAVDDQTPIVLGTLTAADLGLTLSEGLSLVSGAQIDFQGRLAAEGTFSVPAPAGVDAARALLVQVREVGGQTRLVLRAVLRMEGDRLVSSTRIGDEGTALAGVRDPGRYLVVEVDGPVGFAGGLVTAADAQPASGTLVTTSTLGLVSLATAEGAFLAVGRAGANVFAARDLVRSDTASANAMLVAGLVSPLGLSLTAQAPRVTRATPSDQATSVPLSTPVVITFSEPIDPASVSGGDAANVLLFDAGGAVVAGSLALSNANAVVTFRPAAPLAPNARYTLLVGTGVRDVSGYGLAQAFQSTFFSIDTAPPPPPPAGAITAGVPDAQGLITISATQGSASPRDTVTIVNVTTGAITPVLIDPDGGFTVAVPVSLKDRLRVRIADAAGNETVVDLGTFRRVNADGSLSVVVTDEGGVVEGPGGTGARIRPGTFPDGAVVTIKPVDVATLPVNIDPALADVLSMQAALEVDFGGATPQQYVDLVFPARGDEQPDGDWIVTQVVEFNGQRVLNPVDTAKFKQGRIVTSSPPCPGVLAAGVYGAMKSGTEVGINYSQVYNQYGTQWPMRVETSFVPAGLVPLPFVYLVPETVTQACYPVLSGRATVVANGVRIRISGDQLSPRDREVIVTNTARGTTQRFPRNVVELTLDMTGTQADSYTVKVGGPGGEQAVTSLVVSASPQADTVVFRLDMDLIGVPVETVTITNLTRAIERVYNVPLAPFEGGVAGGAGDGYQVEAVNATGQKRTVAHEALDGPYGDGNFLLKVKDGTIDPNAAEAPPGAPGKVRERVRLTSTGGLDLVIPDDRIVLGGIKYAFDAPQADEFRLTVEYVDGTSTSVRIPSFRLTVTNPQTGRVIRTITAPAPPKDEPLELAPISDDVRPPMVISGPTRVNSFDPAGVIEFRFSESMNAASIANLANFIVRDATGQQVLGEFRVSDLNRRVTFIPASPLKLGAEYTVTLKGNDSLSELLEPGVGTGMTDRSGNALPTLRLTLKTFKPRLAGTYGSDFSIKDPVVRTANVEGPSGPQRRTYVVATTAGSGDQDKVIAIDVTDPENPLRTGGSSAKAPTRQWITVLEGASFTRRDGATFTGDLAFASTFNTFYTFGDWYDVTDPAAPRWMGGKIFTTNPDNVTGFNSQGTLKILGFGKGVAMLPTSQGVTSYIAIEKVGIAAANTGENVPERSAQDRILEPYYQGDFTDVVAHGAQLVALERSARRLEVLSADLAPTASVDLPDVPRRVRTLTDLAVDLDQDGLITPDEQFDLAVVGAEGAVLLVDLGAVDNPRVLSRIPLPGVTARSLDVDVERRRLFVSDFSRVFMIDLSRPTQEFSTDADGDGYDDRVIWHAASNANGVAMDVDRGLVYVTTNSGLDIWAVYDNCCDLEVQLTARRDERQVGDRGELLAKEKLALQTAIAKGLAEGNCGAVSILEQGSGACLWKEEPARACGENYQPGLSDHDFEVFFVDMSQPAVDQCIDALTAQFIDPGTRLPKDVALSTGGTMRFEDISFFPVPKAEFEAAKLNIDPPRNRSGTDTTGDLGLGRQQLLLKWLLEGEYIDVPGQPVFGKPLDEILEILKSQTRIPRSEGYEWANLMAFNLAKAKAYLRVGGATSNDSIFHDFSVKQLHDAGKAGIRATLARMVADGPGNAFVLDVTRDYYDTTACRAITPLVGDPAQWAPKPCGSFEEYVASAAARSLVAAPALNLFTKAQVLTEVNRFFRVKSDLDRIGSDAQADAFIRGVHTFVAGVRAATQGAFGGEPDQAKRNENVANAQQKTVEALAATSLHVVPLVSNRGFRGGSDLLVRFFEQPPGGQAAKKGEDVRVSLAGGDRQSLEFTRNADGTIVKDADGNPVPLFKLGPIDVRQNPGQLGHVAFTIDLPGPIMREANRRNNIGGVFFYPLDLAPNASAPVVPPDLPLPPGIDESMLAPDAECNDAPAMQVTQRVLVDGQPVAGVVNIGRGETITVQLKVTNLSGETLTGAVACDSLGSLCYEVPALAPGQSWTKNVAFTAPLEAAIVEGVPSAYGPATGVITGGPLRIVVSCEGYTVVPLDPNPNPVFDADPTLSKSTVQRGGTAVRYFRLINYRTGAPVAGVTATIEVEGGGGLYTFTATSDARGLLRTDSGEEGIQVPFSGALSLYPANTAFTVRVASISGVELACTPPVSRETGITLKDFEYTTSHSRGSFIEGTAGIILGVTGGAEEGFKLENTYATSESGTSRKNLAISVSDSVSVKVAKEFSLFGLQASAGVISGEISVGSTVGQTKKTTRSRKYLFPAPLTAEANCHIARVSLESLYGVDPIVNKLIDYSRVVFSENACGPDGRYLVARGSAFASSATAGGSVGAKVSLPFGPVDAQNVQKAGVVSFGGTAATGYTATTAYEAGFAWDAEANLLRRISSKESYTLLGGIDFAASLSIAKAKVDADTALPPEAKPDLQEKLGIEHEFFKKSLGGLSVSGSTAETYIVAFAYDYATMEYPRPTSISITFAGPKPAGWKATVGGAETNVNAPPAGSRTYVITKPEDIDRLTQQLANLEQIRASSVANQAAYQLSMVPTALQEEYGGFKAQLPYISGSVIDADSVTRAAQAALGLTVKGLGIKLGGRLGVKADVSVARTRQKGTLVGGRSFVLEKYAPSLYPQEPDLLQFDDIESTWRALQNAFAGQFSDQGASINQQGPSTLRSTATAEITIDGTREPAPFDATLYSWKYNVLPGPVRDYAQEPSDTSGPAGVPHYGIGGFHQLGPEDYVLAADTPLVIDYRDEEVAGFDESHLRMYVWNLDRRDWDLVNAVHDPVANTFTAGIRAFGLYTLGLRMPAGTIGLDYAGGAPDGEGPGASRTFVVTSDAIRTNDGLVVPDGTLFTVRSVVAGTTDLSVAYGDVTTTDADSGRDQVQVASVGGRLTFEVRYSSPFGVYVPGRVVVYGAPGTAYGDVVLEAP